MEVKPIAISLLIAATVVPLSSLGGAAEDGSSRRSPWSETADTDRPGFDMARIVMEPGQKDMCAEACKANPLCRAYTWAKKGVQGDKPVCWLKSAVPAVKPSSCCVSGVRLTDSRFVGIIEPGTDRPGGDYTHVALAKPELGLCQAACANDDSCQAFSYVLPGVQGAKAVCYLKDRVPSPAASNCCTSGVKDSALVLYRRFANTDMNGSDYDDMPVTTGGWQACRQSCADDVQCKAYTYVKSTDVSSGGHCWLKNSRPPRRSAACCDSGDKVSGGAAMNLGKHGTDLPGHDYRHFEVSAATESNQHDVCLDACGADGICRAYTYVRPGVQGPKPMCWLKDKVPASGRLASCCTAGTRKPEYVGKPVGPGYVPPVLYFSRPDPGRTLFGHAVPADMPAPNYPKLYKNCSSSDIEAFKAAWTLAHHDMWRAEQLMQFINASDRRGDLWAFGYINQRGSLGNFTNWSPRAWFGTYQPRRFRLSRRAIDKVWKERFLGGKIGSTRIRIWCRRDSGVQPCHGERRAAHTGVGTLDICPVFFRHRRDNFNAQVLIHEMFHWLRIPKSAVWVSDRHDYWRTGCHYRRAQAIYDLDAAYIGMNGGCRHWNYNRAVLTNDDYGWFAATLGEKIYSGAMRNFPAKSFR